MSDRDPQHGIFGHRLGQSVALDGERLDVQDAGGRALVLRFGRGRVGWEREGVAGDDVCDVVEVAPGVFFIDVWLRSATERESETVVFRRDTGRGVRVTSQVLSAPRPGEPEVAQRITAVDVTSGGTQPGGLPLAPTRELVGRRVICDYGAGFAFEQIYLNSSRMAWQCLSGEQPGNSDSDSAAYWRVGDELYLLAFAERAIPCASVIVLDLAARRSTGKFLNIEDDGVIRNGALAALLTPLASAQYPPHLQPC